MLRWSQKTIFGKTFRCSASCQISSFVINEASQSSHCISTITTRVISKRSFESLMKRAFFSSLQQKQICSDYFTPLACPKSVCTNFLGCANNSSLSQRRLFTIKPVPLSILFFSFEMVWEQRSIQFLPWTPFFLVKYKHTEVMMLDGMFCFVYFVSFSAE